MFKRLFFAATAPALLLAGCTGTGLDGEISSSVQEEQSSAAVSSSAPNLPVVGSSSSEASSSISVSSSSMSRSSVSSALVSSSSVAVVTQWQTCAAEKTTCVFEGATNVRYGADSRWIEQTVQGEIDCTNDAFGQDPAPQTKKTCEVPVGVKVIASASSSSTAAPNDNPQKPGDLVIAINVGGEDVTETNGVRYEADQLFSGGEAKSTNANFTGSDLKTIYDTARVGKSFDYSIEVDDGYYDVIWHFRDWQSRKVGDNQFNVITEGEKSFMGLDAYHRMGRFEKPYKLSDRDPGGNEAQKNSWIGKGNVAFTLRTSHVHVTDGRLNLVLDTKVKGKDTNANGNAMLSGIEVRKSQPMKIQGNALPKGEFKEQNGLIVFETENFKRRSKGSNRSYKQEWHLFTDNNKPNLAPDPDEPRRGASGKGYLELLPDVKTYHGGDKDPSNRGLADLQPVGAIVEYEVTFASKGDYRVWLRMYATKNKAGNKISESNSLHIGFNNIWPFSAARTEMCTRIVKGNKYCSDTDYKSCKYLQQGSEKANAWVWTKHRRYPHQGCYAAEIKSTILPIPKAGTYTVKIAMREDGTEIDKVILTKDPTYIPHGFGPEETK